MRLLNRLLPKSLAGRMITLLLLALGAAQVISVVIFVAERGRAVHLAKQEELLYRIASVVHLLNDTPEILHGRALEAVSTRYVQFFVADTSAVDAGVADNRLRRQLSELLEGEAQEILADTEKDDGLLGWPWARGSAEDPAANGETIAQRAYTDKPEGENEPLASPRYRGHPALTIAIHLLDQRWLNVVILTRGSLSRWAWPPLLSLGIMAITVSMVVVLMVRRITRPLARLTTAADRLGRGEDFEPVPEQGSEDVRYTTRAFNRMRERLERFVQDRTRMLAAISHDLRTPLTSLRLRAEFIEDVETREKILDTVEEMQRMTEATLTFARQAATKEETRTVDMAALLDSLCQDLGDLGADVTFEGAEKTPYTCRPVALKRAIRNLIENAVAYGQRARVTLNTTADDVMIVIDDEGSGIPEVDFERAFEPFVRLEESRNPETGGIGLGMSIARSIVRGHGGDISLQNRVKGGLRVSILLPRHEPPHR